MQDTLVALIVAACFGYAVWMLMPAVVRRGLARRALALPWPSMVAERLQRAARTSGGCACDGCDTKPTAKPGATHPIQIHRAPRR